MLWEVINLRHNDGEAIRQAAALLVEGFKEQAPDAWPDMDAALEEVRESFREDRISRVAVDEEGQVVGWIGGIKQYRGNVWELHPLVVRSDRQRRGIGRALVADLEQQVRERGGLTIWAGSDDEADMTSLSGINLFPNPLEHVAKVRNLRDHPYAVYQRVGFALVGVMLDANGLGKPGIFLAKSVGRK